MPESTLKAVSGLKDATDAITGRYAESRAVINRLATVGIDLIDVADILEREGIASFVQSWDDVFASVERQIKKSWSAG